MKYTIKQGLPLLQNTPTVVQSLAEELNRDWTHSNEGPDTWSFYDILGHLIHCEEADWIPRLEIILSDNKNKRFTPLDRTAHINKTKGLSVDDLVLRFISKRADNLHKLQRHNLSEDAMFLEGTHPEFGGVTIEALLSAWVVHDLNHISQMCRVLAYQFKESVGPWKAYMPILDSK
jgi:hypothetical protein